MRHVKKDAPLILWVSQDKLHYSRSCDYSTETYQVSPNLASLGINSTHRLTSRLQNFTLSPSFGSRSATTIHHYRCQGKTIISVGATKTDANTGISVCYNMVIHLSVSKASVITAGKFKLPQWPQAQVTAVEFSQGKALEKGPGGSWWTRS